MRFANVTITPSIPAGTYTENDVLFNPTELKLPARGARLISLYSVDTEKQLSSDSIALYFFQKNTHDLGTQNEAANISDANFRANQFIGAVSLTATNVNVLALANVNIRYADTYNDSADQDPLPLSVALSSIETGNAIYVAAVLDSVSTDPVFSGANSVDLVFGFEY